MKKNLVWLVVCGGVLVIAPACGLAATTFATRRAFVMADTVDPTEKARMLAEGISAAMNFIAVGIGVAVIAFVAGIVFAIKLHRESKRGE